MRHLLEMLPGAVLPDPQKESDAPGIPLEPPDDDDLLRPAGEEALFVAGHTQPGRHRTLAGRVPGALAKHLLQTFGPIHPALPFPLALRLELDGDRVATADPEIGFLHQGLEKAAEQASFADGARALFAAVERASPLAPQAVQIATALAVEKLWRIDEQVPLRAALWRCVALELLRAAEHLRVVSAPPLVPAHKARRAALGEAARTAAGLLDGISAGGTFARIGGLGRALDDDEIKRIAGELARAGDAARAALAAAEADDDVDAHLDGLGPLSAYDAIAHGLSGPALRACGISDDLRVHDAPLAYPALTTAAEWKPAVHTTGCARARVRLRHEEVVASLALIERAFAMLQTAPPGVAVDVPAGPPPAGSASVALETHNGELLVSVVADGTERPRRVRLRTASTALVMALPVALRGARIDDVIPVLHSFGITGTEVDR